MGAVYGKGFAAARFRAMELITILNRCYRFRGFIYHHARFSPDKKSIKVSVRPRKGSAAICSRCHQTAPEPTRGGSSPLLRTKTNIVVATTCEFAFAGPFDAARSLCPSTGNVGMRNEEPPEYAWVGRCSMKTRPGPI
jgi:hypothetical protein